jgi:hypothetical protein
MRRALAVVLVSLAAAATSANSGQVPGGWQVPRTAWGDPDFQGTWTNADDTPFERPLQQASAAETLTGDHRWSQIVDPPDGRIPILPMAAEYTDYAALGETWVHHSPLARCITRGVPDGMFPFAYNNGYQIVQSPGYVVIFAEMIHEARIIPVNGTAHPPSTLRFWNGDSRGHWESDTLVIDTANYNDKGWVRVGQAPPAAGDAGVIGYQVRIPQTETLHVVERLKRAAPNTIFYSATLEDPRIFAKPWSVGLLFSEDPSYRIFEYACHEGNASFMEGLLKSPPASKLE